jgi:hypothetical protein
MAINLTGGLPPEILGQQQQLNRQQQMAQMLMQQGSQQPQGQMVSGRYVQPSIFAQLAPLAQLYAGQKIAERGDQKALDLAKQLRQQYGDELREFRNLMQGREELAPEQAGPTQTGPTQTGQAIPQEMVRGAPNVQGAYDFAATAYNPALQAAGLRKLTEGPIKVGDALLDPVTYKPIYQSERKPVVVGAGGALVDEKGKLIYQAPFKPEAGEGGQDGGYNKKGDWITPNKIFIGKSEVSKDREIAFTADQVRQGLKEISPEDVKKASSVFGNLTGSGPINYLAQQLGNEAVAAQTKINASSVMQILNNLPPGPASDKDIENAKSTFPGYGNQKALNEWIKNTRESLDRKVNSLNQKYGSESWYGNTNLNALNTEDKAALDWANANPNDPRSAQIKQRLGK